MGSKAPPGARDAFSSAPTLCRVWHGRSRSPPHHAARGEGGYQPRLSAPGRASPAGGAWRRVSPLSTNSTAGSGVRWVATWVSTELQKEDRCSPAGARLKPWLLCLEKSHHPGEWPSDTGGAGGHGGATWERWPKAFGCSEARLASIVQVWPAGERGPRELPQHNRLSPLIPATAGLLVLPGTHGRVDR